ncbi:MAG: TIGR04053 family radical SAM/SPASM domain-containing protein [Thermoprotei archaeon]
MFEDRPVLVFWETTKACLLSCVHCRAEAIKSPLPGELNSEEGYALIDQVAEFGEPYPTIIFTGGDPLMRSDIFELLEHARKRGIKFALSPSVTPLLTRQKLAEIKSAGVSAISISIDGASPATHDGIRRVAGTYERSLEVLDAAVELGLNAQVNTTVMRRNVLELPDIFHTLRSHNVKVWEVFFLIRVGRGVGVDDLDASENESVLNFLYEASHYGVIIRTVEAPSIRRVLRTRADAGEYWNHPLYRALKTRLIELKGRPTQKTTISPRGTLDGDGIIFVGYEGTVYPGGLTPIPLGNIRRQTLAQIYRSHPLLLSIRKRELSGPCGVCEYKHICGGSRARAYASSRDPLGSDPGCVKTNPVGPIEVL